MRPVGPCIKGLGWNAPYPESLKHLTASGLHKGIDYLCPMETPIYAPVDGILCENGYMPQLGWTVWIKFWIKKGLFAKDTYRVKLGHFSKIYTIKVGDKVKKSQLLGLSGNSGASTAPHLHLQLEKLIGNWVPIDPVFINA